MSNFDESFDRAIAAVSKRPIRDVIKGHADNAFVVVNRQTGLFYRGQGYEKNPAVWTQNGKDALRYATDSMIAGAGKVAEATGGEAVQATFHLSPEHGELGVQGPRGQGGGKWNYEHLIASYGRWAKKCLEGMDPRQAADLVRTESANDIHFIALDRMANAVRNAQRKAKDAMVFVVHSESLKGKSSKVWMRLTAWNK